MTDMNWRLWIDRRGKKKQNMFSTDKTEIWVSEMRFESSINKKSDDLWDLC